MFFAVAPNPQIQNRRQRIDDGNAHAVQTAGNLIRILVEFSARMQLSHNDFRCGNTFFLVQIRRNAATVVPYRNGTVGIDNDIRLCAISRQSFVNRVIQNFVHHMVQSRSVIRIADIHPRTFAHRVKAF